MRQTKKGLMREYSEVVEQYNSVIAKIALLRETKAQKDYWVSENIEVACICVRDELQSKLNALKMPVIGFLYFHAGFHGNNCHNNMLSGIEDKIKNIEARV